MSSVPLLPPPPVHGATPPPPSNGTEAGPSPPEQPEITIVDLAKQLRELSEKSETRMKQFGVDIARLRSTGKATDIAPEAPQHSQQTTNQPIGYSSDDLFSAIEIGQMLIGLPDAAREQIAELRSSGAPIAEIARMARMIRAVMGPGANPGEQASAIGAPSKSKDRAATAPSRTAVQHPRTLSEYYQLAREHPEQKKLLDKDPTFHPEDLPHRE